MKIFKKLIVVFSLLVYSIILFLLVTLNNFPYHILEKITEDMIYSNFKVNMDISDLKFNFPFSWSSDYISIIDNKDVLLFRANNINFNPSIISLMSFMPSFNINLQPFGGDLNLNLSSNIFNKNLKMDLSLQDLQLSKIDCLQKYIPVDKLQGEVASKIDIDLNPFKGLDKSSGSLELTVDKLEGVLNDVFLKGIMIKNGSIKVKSILENSKCRFKLLNIKMDGLQGKLSGYLQLTKNILKSKIFLNGNFRLDRSKLRLPQSYLSFLRRYIKGGRFRLEITGTILRPHVSFK